MNLSTENSPNIILVVWDAVRPKNLSCYGHIRQTTPHLDELARQSILYTQAHTVSPWSLPSHASLFTGLYPSQHKVDRGYNLLSDVKSPVLPEWMGDHGYQTVGFFNNAWLTPQFGFDRGFDRTYYGWRLVQGATDFFAVQRRMNQGGRFQDYFTLLESVFHKTPLRNLVNGLYSRIAFRYDKGAWLTNRHVKSWFRSIYDVNKPFFMFVHYMEPHLKYSPPQKYRDLFLLGKDDKNRIKNVNQNALDYMLGKSPMTANDFDLLEILYDAELAYLDTRFAEFIDILKEQDVLENSILILTSDHGENIGEHELMDHQYYLYETLLHVPLLIYMPGTPSPQVVNQRVEIKDIFPTILDLLDMKDEFENLNFPGHSLISDKFGELDSKCYIAEYLQPQPSIDELRNRYPGFDPFQYDRSLRSITTHDSYKFIWASDGTHELYDLGRDPSESNNIIGINPGKAKELEKLLTSYLPPLEEVFSEGKTSPLAFEDPTIRKRLQDLGYL